LQREAPRRRSVIPIHPVFMGSQDKPGYDDKYYKSIP